MIGGNLAFGMGDGELTNQHPAWEILQEILQEILWEMAQEMLWKMTWGGGLGRGLRECWFGRGPGVELGWVMENTSDNACLEKWLRKSCGKYCGK